MSKRKVEPASDDDQESTDSEAARFFQFIDLSNNDPDLQKKNRTKARSHAMKNVRRRRQKEQGDKDAVVLSTKELADFLKELYSQQFSAQMGQNLLKSANSLSSRLEADLNPALTFQGRWSPLAHQMLNHLATMATTSFFSPSSANKATTSAMDGWDASHACPMTFHAIISCVAAARDYLFNTTADGFGSLEGLAHRGEALRLINESLTALQKDANAQPSDELLLSVLALTAEVPDSHAQGTECPQTASNKHPFRLPLMSSGWEQQFVPMRHNRMHHNALFTLIERKGGLKNIGNQSIAKMISNHDILIAALDLAPPKQPFIEVDEVTQLLGDTSLNILPEPKDEDEAQRGTFIASLAAFGVPQNLVSLLHDLHRTITYKEAVPRGLVQNLNLVALTSRQQALHHAILSLPQRDPHSNLAAPIPRLYHPLRLVLHIFAVGLLFPLPPSTGALARLVLALKASLDAALDGAPIDDRVPCLVWILFVGAIAARGMAERRWFVERLAGLCEWEGVTRWKEVKGLVRGYVWCGDAMDDEGMEVWDDVRGLVAECECEGEETG